MKQCTHCGQELPGDNAQFCGRCGMLLSSEPSRPQSPEEKPATPQAIGSPPQEVPGEKSSLREQIAQHPLGRWSSIAPENATHFNISKRESSSPSLSEYPPVPSTLKSQPSPEPGPLPPQSQTPRPPTGPASQMHISASKKDESPEPAAPTAMFGNRPTSIEDLPTTNMPAAPMSESGLVQREAPARPVSRPGAGMPIEDLPTTNMPAAPMSESGLVQREAPARPVSRPGIGAGSMPVEDLSLRNMPLTPVQRNVLGDMPAHLQKTPQAHIDEIARVDTLLLPAGSVGNTPPVQAISPAHPASRQTPKHRATLIIAAILVVIVLLGGGVWIYQARPFSVAEITQPWQPLHDSRMGVALNYPTGWPEGSYDKAGTLSLHDSSNTAMVTFSKTAASGTDPTHTLQNQATKLALTNVKSLDALSFAGVKWQREQGSMQINGATYTVVLFVGAHGNSLYTLGQLAAQNVYADYEQAIFAPMRTSLHFL